MDGRAELVVDHFLRGLRSIKKKSKDGRARSGEHGQATWWNSTLSPKVNLHHAINFRALCGANLVTQPSEF